MATNSIQTQIKDFLPLCKLGEGAFSTVYKVKRSTDGQIYALKKIKMQKLKEKEKQNSLNQIRILASIKSEFIISYKQAFYDQNLNLLCVVMQYANGGDLQIKISDHKKAKTKFSESQIWKAASQILIGLYVLHEKGILHRDLKSANVFISNQIYKLGDLNVSKVNHEKDQMARTQTGTPYYASPQVWRDQAYDSKCDIWSFGCLLYEMCCFNPPFQGDDLDQLYKSVQKGKYSQIPSIYSSELSNLIRCCLKVNPSERTYAKELFSKFSFLRQKHVQFLQRNEQSTEGNLLKTIRLPDDLRDLSKNLPSSEYQILLKEQPKTIYPQVFSNKQTVMLKNKSNICQRSTQKKLPLQQRIKDYFIQNKSTQIRKRPQRPQTSQKNKQIIQKLYKRPLSALCKPQRANKIVYKRTQHKIIQNNYQKQANLPIRLSSGRKDIQCQDKIIDKNPKDIQNSINQNYLIPQYRCKSSSSRNKNFEKQRRPLSSNNKMQQNKQVQVEQTQKSIRQSLAPINEQLYQRCKENSLKRISSLQKKVKYIRQQRKNRKITNQNNKQNASCLIKSKYYKNMNEESMDMKQQLSAKIKHNFQILKQNSQLLNKKNNNEKASMYTPLLKQSNLNIQNMSQNKSLNDIENIKKRLQIRKNKILSARRNVVSADNKRVKAYTQNSEVQSIVKSSQKVKRFGIIRTIPKYLLPSIQTLIKKQQKSLPSIRQNKYQRQQTLNIKQQAYIGSDNIVQDSEAILRLKKRIKSRIIGNCNQQKNKYTHPINLLYRKNQSNYY